MKQLSPTFGTIINIASPISVSLIIPQISFLVNTLFVSQLGTHALSVIGITGVYYLLLTWMGYGLSNGLLVILSKQAGRNDIISFRQSFNTGFILTLIFSAILICISWFGIFYFYESTLQDRSMIMDATSFIRWRVWGLPFLFTNQIINAFLISTNNTRWLLIGSIVGNSITIIMDYVFIFGWGPIHAWGINGAAIGSILGELSYMVAMFIIVINRKWHISYKIFQNIKWLRNEVLAIIKLSSPLIFQYIFSIGGWQIFFIYMEHNGNDHVAATHILRSALGIIGIGAWALASTSNTLIGNIIGQSKKELIPTAIKRLLITSLTYSSIISILLYTCKDFIISYFTDDFNIIHLVHEGLKVLYFSCVIMCCGTVLFNAVIGAGETRKSMLFEIISVVTYTIFIIIVCGVLNGNFYSAWTSEYVYWSILLVLSGNHLIRFVKKGNNQHIS